MRCSHRRPSWASSPCEEQPARGEILSTHILSLFLKGGVSLRQQLASCLWPVSQRNRALHHTQSGHWSLSTEASRERGTGGVFHRGGDHSRGGVGIHSREGPREQRQEGSRPIPPGSDLLTGLLFLGGDLKGTSHWNYLGWPALSAFFSGVHYHPAMEACSSSRLVLASSRL